MGLKSGKRIRAAWEKVERERLYTLEEAVALLTDLPKAKFDESVDLAISLGVNPRKAEENVRGTVTLPHGTGKTIRVVAFCQGEKVKEAQDAGADYSGIDELIEKIQGGWFDFDAAVATPDVMAKVGRIGKLLGPRGLMPNPKVGTVSAEIGKAVEAIKSGRVEFRVEKAGIVHLAFGKLSFEASKILDNANAVIDALVKAKPQSSKGVYLKAICLSTTMGPGLKVNPLPYR